MVIHLTGLSNRNITATRFFTGIARVSARNNLKKLRKNEVERLARNTKMFVPNVAWVVVLNHVFKPEIMAFQVSTRFFF